MLTPSGRGIDAWPEDPEDLRRTAEILGQITRDTHDNDSGVTSTSSSSKRCAWCPTPKGPA